MEKRWHHVGHLDSGSALKENIIRTHSDDDKSFVCTDIERKMSTEWQTGLTKFD